MAEAKALGTKKRKELEALFHEHDISDFKWIDLPVFDEYGYPRHQRGVVPEAPGLYFVGLPFQTALTSALLGGVSTDASYIAGKIARSGSLN